MTHKAGWEVEGFIDRLTRRNDANSERLVAEAISHLRGFSRDCDALRESNQELRADIERLQTEVELLTASRREIMKIDEERVAEIERLKEIEIKYDQLISGAFT